MTYQPPRRSDGTIQELRAKAQWPVDRPFRILSIDGGGIAGVLPAAYLAELEKRFLGGQSIAKCFDLIAGTSTGGIIALGLSAGLTAQEVLAFYEQRGGLLFPKGNPWSRFWRKQRQNFRYVYDPKVLQAELRQVFGQRVLDEAQTRLVIPSYEGVHGEPWIYKTPHHLDFTKDRHEQMVNVALATSAAPAHFPSFRHNDYIYVDGGIWANNPVMNAIVDALSCFDVERRSVKVLSLGCGETVHKVNPGMANGGFFQWRKVIQPAVRAQSRNALGQAFLLLGKDNVVRVDAPESEKPVPLDDHARACSELPNMARALAEANGHLVFERYLSDQVEPFSSVFNAA